MNKIVLYIKTFPEMQLIIKLVSKNKIKKIKKNAKRDAFEIVVN
jgi:hypothetical protein